MHGNPNDAAEGRGRGSSLSPVLVSWRVVACSSLLSPTKYISSHVYCTYRGCPDHNRLNHHERRRYTEVKRCKFTSPSRRVNAKGAWDSRYMCSWGMCAQLH